MTTPEHSDQEIVETVVLLQRHKDGSRGAIEELFRRYEGRVRRIVQVRMGAFLRTRSDVEDVVQETLMRAFTSIDRFETQEDAKLINWMASIAENSLRDLFGREKAQKRDAGREVPMNKLRGNDHGDSMAWDIASPSVSPAEKASTSEVETIIDDCLLELKEEEREIILLVDYAGASWEYVLEQTARPTVEAAQKFHRRARINLAGRVERKMNK